MIVSRCKQLLNFCFYDLIELVSKEKYNPRIYFDTLQSKFDPRNKRQMKFSSSNENTRKVDGEKIIIPLNWM